MNARNPRNAAWFADIDPADVDAGVEAVRSGGSNSPQEWPDVAVERDVVADEAAYYRMLRAVTIEAARRAVAEREMADDQQLIHAIRALDDCQRTVNELTERVAEWAGSLDATVAVDVRDVRALAERKPRDPTSEPSDRQTEAGKQQSEPGDETNETATPVEHRVQSLAARVVALDDEANDLRTFIEQTAPEVAPNLSALAGPLLAARLVALAGGLEELAKKPAGTVQVLGAEDALFAHLRGGAPAPKHGIIFTHEIVREMPRGERGSAARALAGKLAIAARIDHYSGDRRPELEADLEERIERIRARDQS